jgi:hypothetical protein
MRYELNPDDPLELPEWLRVDAAEAARRKQEWIDNPPRPMPAFHQPRKANVSDADVTSFLAEETARKEKRAEIGKTNRFGKLRDRHDIHPDSAAGKRILIEQRVASLKTFIESRRPGTDFKAPVTNELAALCEEWHTGSAPKEPVEVMMKVKPLGKRETARLARGGLPGKAKPAKPAAKAAATRGSPTMVTITEMISRPAGATLAELAAATSTFEHSCSASLSGIRKTRTIEATVESGRGRVYRLKPEEK